MNQAIVRTAKGLFTQFNRLEVPPGALQVADNCVIDRPGVIEKRRGFTRYGSALSAAGATLLKYDRRLLVLDGTTLKYDSDGAGTWASYSGSYSAPTGCKMEGVEVQESFFFSTSSGIYKLASLTGTPAAAGIPPGLDTQVALTGGSGFMANDSQVSYRVVWGRTDANNQEALGEPSYGVTLTNSTGGSRNVTVTSSLPSGIVAGDWYEVYRTSTVSPATTDPGDRHRFVIRNTVVSGDLTAGYVTHTDTTVDADLGEDLYTNPLLETISKANARPPYAEHIAAWKGHLWFLNTRQPHFKEIRLLDVASIVDDTDAITITTGGVGRAYTFSTAENQSSRKFQRFTAGGTTAANVRDTMKSFCKIFNRDTGNTAFWARYVSGTNDNPGMVQIMRRDVTDTTFTLTASAGCSAKFSPTIPTSGTTLASEADAKPNGLYRSKFEKPESVPTTNYDPVGSANYEGLGLIALKDALIVLKEDGYFMVMGSTDGSSGSGFTITQLDPTLKLLAPATAVTLDNAVYAFTTQGAIRSTESGSKIMSWPVEDSFNRIAQLQNFSTIAHAVAYESDRKYLLATQERSGDTSARVLWVYNYVTECWTRWDIPTSSGIVLEQTSGGDRLYLAHQDDAYILEERKSFLASDVDYTDEDLSCTVTATGTTTDSDGNTVTTATITYTGGYEIEAGWLFTQGTEEAIVTDSDLVTSTTFSITLDREITVTAAAATVSKAICMEVQWMPEYGGNAASVKQFSEGQIYYERDGGTHVMGFCADTQTTPSYTDPIEISKSYGWGVSPWGETAWGDSQLSPSSPTRAWVPRNHQRARGMRLIYENTQAKEKVAILQVTYGVQDYGNRTQRNP